MVSVNRQVPVPQNVPRSRRNHAIATLTSMPAGKMVPLAVFPMLREDKFTGSFQVAVEMLETREFLMNPVNLRVMAYCVPWLAFERFEGSRDQFDRSYAGLAKIEGGATVPFFETAAAGAYGANPIRKYLGLHAAAADNVNTMYDEAYNLIWNYRALNRSPLLTPRGRLTNTLAPAFWSHGRFENVVPDFDQAVIDGEIALNIIGGQLPLVYTGGAPVTTKNVTRVATAADLGWKAFNAGGSVDATAAANMHLFTATSDTYIESGNSGTKLSLDPNGGLIVTLSDIFAEMDASGVTVSLSNLELARKTQTFARIREQYEGIDDDHIIDMLMGGMQVPDQALKNPFLIADQITRIGQAKRYATDAGNLNESAVSGGALVGLNLRVPRINTGGVVMVVAEAVPEQLFERQRDPFFHLGAVADLPEFQRDYLDPEKVDVVKNGEIDTAHATPTATFGYAPMNWKWTAFGPRVGGKFFRPSTDLGTDDDRMRLWAVEATNPVLATDFYIVSSIHVKPFLDTAVDPFEVTMMGNAVIEGNTVFGGLLVESGENYDAVLAKADQDRIVKP